METLRVGMSSEKSKNELMWTHIFGRFGLLCAFWYGNGYLGNDGRHIPGVSKTSEGTVGLSSYSNEV